MGELTGSRREVLKGLAASTPIMATVAAAQAAQTDAGKQSNPATADVIVVGAGMAGLSAALELSDAGSSVVVLEANERAGGRVKRAEVAGVAVDAGGMWLSSAHTELAAMIDECGLSTYATHVGGEGYGFFRDTSGRFPGEDPSSLFPASVLQPYTQSYVDFLGLEASVDLASLMQTENALALDAQSVDQWARKYGAEPAFLDGWDLTTRTIVCARSSDVSLLSFLHYCRSGGGIELLSGLSDGGAQHLLVDGGMFQVSDQLAARLGHFVRYDEPVFSIEQSNEQVSVRTSRSEYVGKRVICTQAPALAGRINYEPPLSPGRDGLTQRAPMGAVVKFWAAYDKPFWREQGLNGFVLSSEHSASALFDVTPPSTQKGIVAGFFDAHEAVKWAGEDSEKRQEEALRLLTDAFGEQAASPIGFTDAVWPNEPWARGCFGTYCPPGVLSRYSSAIRTPEGRVHWAGTFSSPEWTGHIEGAIRSGKRAAAEVLETLSKEARV